MTDNRITGAFRRLLTMTLALVMVLGTAMPLMTLEASAFNGKVGSKYTVTDGGRITYGSGEGGYSNSRKCDLGDDLGNRYSYCVQPAKTSPPTGQVTVDKVVTDEDDKGKWNALRNVVYYSPSYPGYDENVNNIRSKFYTGNFSKDWGIAHLALSYIYAEDRRIWQHGPEHTHRISAMYGPRQRRSATRCGILHPTMTLMFLQPSRYSSHICPESRT